MYCSVRVLEIEKLSVGRPPTLMILKRGALQQSKKQTIVGTQSKQKSRLKAEGSNSVATTLSP